jgi:hypothetical protein
LAREATEWLLKRRQRFFLRALRVDTLSLEKLRVCRRISRPHRLLAAIWPLWGLRNGANLDQVPAAGAVAGGRGR